MQIPEGSEFKEIPDGGDGELQTPFCEIQSITVKEKEKLKNKIKEKIYSQHSLRSKNLFRTKRSTVNAKMQIWNNLKFFNKKTKKVKFIIPYKVLSKYDKVVFKTVLDVMDLISKKTCVAFTNIDNNKRYKGKDYLAIVNEPGCHSVIGRNPGKNILHLEFGPKLLNLKTGLWVRKTCVKHRIILHELFHLIGLFHEHQRSDRDAYIEVFKNNIREDKKINFETMKNDETWGLPYDYDSIMNYRENAFAKNANDLTIKIRNGNHLCHLGMGTHEHASELDFLLVNLLYNCTGVEKMVENYVDKHYFTKPLKKLKKVEKLKYMEKVIEKAVKERVINELIDETFILSNKNKNINKNKKLGKNKKKTKKKKQNKKAKGKKKN